MNKKCKTLLISLSVVTVLGLAVGGTYAYFNYTSSSNAVGIVTNINDETVVEVASFKELFACTKAEFYDDKSIVSSDDSRKIVKLTDDITLTDELYITADVHIDLNGHTLNLNGNALTFKHGYAGVFAVYDGVMETGDGGYLCVDMENATFETYSVNVTENGVSVNLDEHLEIVNLDAKYTAYGAFYYAVNTISSSLNERVAFLDYKSVKDDGFTFSDNKFIFNKNCSVATEKESCAFIYKDIDFKYNYLSSDIVISYVSSNEDVLSNYGNYTAPSTMEDVTLAINVSSEKLSIDETVEIPLHVVNLSDEATKNAVGEALIKEYLEPYYRGKSLGDIFDDYYYYFPNATSLPTEAFDGLITYSYATTNLTDDAVETNSKVNGNAYSFNPNEDCFHLLVTVNGQVSPLKLNMYSTSLNDYKTVAWLMINELYGGSIVFDATVPKKDLYTYEEIRVNPSTKDFVDDFHITGVSYKLKEDSEVLSHYTLENDALYLIEDAPIMIKTPYVTMTLNYINEDNEPESVSVDLFVQYLDVSGDSLSNYIPYYSAYDPLVVTSLTSSFAMPFAYGKGAPYNCFDFVTDYDKLQTTFDGVEVSYYEYDKFGMPESLTVSLYYNGAERLVFDKYTENKSFTKQLDAYLSANSLKLSDIAKYEDAKYVIEIDTKKVTKDDVDVLLIYNYKFVNTGDWSKYLYIYNNEGYQTEITVSEFSVSGGLYFDETGASGDENAIYDENFFVWIYNNYKPSGDDITTADVGDLIIPLAWLGQEREMNVETDSSLNAVNDFYGIGNLNKVSKINLSGKTVSNLAIQGISTLKSLTELKLVGCNLTDVYYFRYLTSVKSLDISNNSVSYFDSLVFIASLEEVYLYDNHSDNKYYGSKGICNSQAFVDLMRNGTSVYNTVSNGVPMLYAESDSIDDYKRLKQIAYQDKLSKNVSIELLYSDFSTATTDYKLSSSGTLTWGYAGDANDPARAEGTTVYTAEYFYVKYEFSGYTLTVKYYVERY